MGIFDKAGTDDPDGDGLINSLEFASGRDPNDSDSNNDGIADWAGVPGYLYAEQWNNVPGSSLAAVFASSNF